jgi:hypothetical protein
MNKKELSILAYNLPWRRYRNGKYGGWLWSNDSRVKDIVKTVAASPTKRIQLGNRVYLLRPSKKGIDFLQWFYYHSKLGRLQK